MDRWIDDPANSDGNRSQRPDTASVIVEALLRRDRVIVLGALVVITSLAWAYLLAGAGMEMDMQGMDMNMVMPMEWTPGYALVVFLMWWLMMTAMMLPGVAPLILLFALVNRRCREQGAPYVPTAVFASGYLLVWGAFSLAATLLQCSMQKAGWLTMGMASAYPWLGGALLLAAGIYQFTPFKHSCLRHCRGPIEFIARHWRPGYGGALRMGMKHGAYCAGCCWLVMGLLFYGGVMNLYWIVGLALLVLLEKLLPAGHALGRFSGAGFIAWGVWHLAAAV
jgi:predicted metal-binding membrane protein